MNSLVWALPASLAATKGISFDFFSSRYLDVSVPWVGREQTMYSSAAGRYSLRGLSHSEISGSQPVSGSPKLFAAVHVLHRLSSPRHPPCALCSLTVPLRHASSSHTGFELRISFARSLASIRTLSILMRLIVSSMSMSISIQLSEIRGDTEVPP